MGFTSGGPEPKPNVSARGKEDPPITLQHPLIIAQKNIRLDEIDGLLLSGVNSGGYHIRQCSSGLVTKIPATVPEIPNMNPLAGAEPPAAGPQMQFSFP